MKQYTTILVAIILISSSLLNAQNDLPSNAQPGKCYVQCFTPDQYETIVEEVLLREASSRIEIIPAVYEEVEEQILVKESYKVLNIIPANFTTQSEQLLVKEAANKLEYTLPIFETITEQILVQPATTKWMKSKADENCLNNQNPEACKVWCLQEIPAKYTTITRQVLKSPASTTEIPIPAEYKTITKAVVQNPAQVAENEIPAEYRAVTKKVLVTPATTQEVTIPAEYSTVTTRRLVNKGGFTEWVEVICPTNCFPKVSLIQQALKARGYDPGAIDNVIGRKTKDALIQFQIDNGLRVGQLTSETLRLLGLQ